jgi:hypothetical protein
VETNQYGTACSSLCWEYAGEGGSRRPREKAAGAGSHVLKMKKMKLVGIRVLSVHMLMNCEVFYTFFECVTLFYLDWHE